MKKYFVTILKYLEHIIGVLSCLMSFIDLPVTLVFLRLSLLDKSDPPTHPALAGVAARGGVG
ncbi:hypothetical protein ACPTGZ_13355, partial [Enterococcus faecium]|uniref:hypothetical protein n=1 Tax=Enterococcus faecium TaxID=1352 RepID=UPI003CC670D7